MLNGVDLFSGAGGFSAGAEESGNAKIVFGVNHWPVAIQTHSANHPHAKHACATLRDTHPSECERIRLLLASPPCPGHSRGNVRPTTESARSDAWDTMRWIEFHRPIECVFENVPEYRHWGPLNGNGRPIASLRGKFFDAWLMAIRSAGYRVDWQILNAANFGAPTARERIFVRARLGTRDPVWPEPTHKREDWLTVRGVLEDVPGKSIPGRSRPLAEATMQQIEQGRRDFGGKFLVQYYGSSGATSIDRPLPTITTRDRFGLVDADTYRMLTNRELAAAQGFRPEYVFCGTKKDVTCQIGNSVSPPVAKAICSVF